MLWKGESGESYFFCFQFCVLKNVKFVMPLVLSQWHPIGAVVAFSILFKSYIHLQVVFNWPNIVSNVITLAQPFSSCLVRLTFMIIFNVVSGQVSTTFRLLHLLCLILYTIWKRNKKCSLYFIDLFVWFSVKWVFCTHGNNADSLVPPSREINQRNE